MATASPSSVSLKDVQNFEASCKAFSALLGNGSSVTWGDAATGGDSSDVQEQLKNAQQILASPAGGFAATLTDGSVVTWGGADFGGDSYTAQDQLRYCTPYHEHTNKQPQTPWTSQNQRPKPSLNPKRRALRTSTRNFSNSWTTLMSARKA